MSRNECGAQSIQWVSFIHAITNISREAIPAEEVKTLESTGTRIDKTLPGNDLKSGKDLSIFPKLTEVHAMEHTSLILFR